MYQMKVQYQSHIRDNSSQRSSVVKRHNIRDSVVGLQMKLSECEMKYVMKKDATVDGPKKHV